MVQAACLEARVSVSVCVLGEEVEYSLHPSDHTRARKHHSPSCGGALRGGVLGAARKWGRGYDKAAWRGGIVRDAVSQGKWRRGRKRLEVPAVTRETVCYMILVSLSSLRPDPDYLPSLTGLHTSLPSSQPYTLTARAAPRQAHPQQQTEEEGASISGVRGAGWLG